ncbi:hypothetical protein [Succinivibrio sp.]|uniref:hypothetical protein n=1 Tax=Succinivibrio sp. TaxID=2053619 RepID=UPI0025F06FFF|nr:hypothetical protein [Succinivibrio sp.]MBQ9220136.1 hypothetical protein [Succinivibrio sp.]
MDKVEPVPAVKVDGFVEVPALVPKELPLVEEVEAGEPKDEENVLENLPSLLLLFEFVNVISSMPLHIITKQKHFINQNVQ